MAARFGVWAARLCTTMRLSTTDMYAFQALAYLAMDGHGAWVPGEAISAATGVAQPYLARVLATLVGSGIVKSKKGAGGGYALARAAVDINLRDVLRAVDGPVAPLACVSLKWRVRCPEEWRCHARSAIWEKVRDGILEVLSAVSVEDLAVDFRRGVRYQACLERLLSPRAGSPSATPPEAP